MVFSNRSGSLPFLSTIFGSGFTLSAQFGPVHSFGSKLSLQLGSPGLQSLSLPLKLSAQLGSPGLQSGFDLNLSEITHTGSSFKFSFSYCLLEEVCWEITVTFCLSSLSSFFSYFYSFF